jgi:hypothetical protein
MDERIRTYLEANQSAAMITLRKDGTPHVARVGVGLVDGRLWSSGTQSRVRTEHIRRDPRSTLFVFGGGYGWLGLETHVTILDGPDVPQRTLGFMREMQSSSGPAAQPGRVMWFGQEKTEEEFLQIMVDEQRLLYEFEIVRAYGMY